jgi:hypothetical protein
MVLAASDGRARTRRTQQPKRHATSTELHDLRAAEVSTQMLRLQPGAPAALGSLQPDHGMGSWIDGDPSEAIARAHRQE